MTDKEMRIFLTKKMVALQIYLFDHDNLKVSKDIYEKFIEVMKGYNFEDKYIKKIIC